MSSLTSVQYMKDELSKAIGEGDWPLAQRCRDRLQFIILESTRRNEPDVIQAAGAVLSETGLRLEIMNNLAMNYDAAAMAWQLRADAGMAALAQRIRPVCNAPGPESEPEKTETPLTVEGLWRALEATAVFLESSGRWGIDIELFASNLKGMIKP